MAKKLLLLLLLFFLISTTRAQELWKYNTTPTWEVSTNLLYDVTRSLNLGVEYKVSNDFTVKLPVTYNPWGKHNPKDLSSDNKKSKFLLFQPELRWWMCEPFSGHFFGLQGNYGIFNVAGVGTDYMKEHRFQGSLWGVGITYGYQFYLAKQWSLEASIGAGYASLTYDMYYCASCGEWLRKEQKDYFGLTSLGLSVIYILK
jgi:opacity protein-like surface antigen